MGQLGQTIGNVWQRAFSQSSHGSEDAGDAEGGGAAAGDGDNPGEDEVLCHICGKLAGNLCVIRLL